jgi:hypothetical protein
MIKIRNESGTVLIASLLMVAIVANLTLLLLMQQQQMIAQYTLMRRYHQSLLIDQKVLAYFAGPKPAELAQPYFIQNNFTPKHVFTGGFFTAEIIDLQSKFNINSLVTPGGKKIFQALLTHLDPTIAHASSVVDAIIYSITAHYAGALLRSISELRTIKALPLPLYQTLKPYLSALPTSVLSINLQTAAPRLLQALTDNPAAIQTFIAARKAALNPLTLNESLKLLSSTLDPTFFTVSSNYFMVVTRVFYDGAYPFTHYTVLQKSNLPTSRTVKILSKSEGIL